MKKFCLPLFSLLAVLGAPAVVRAQDTKEQESLGHYNKGVTAYDLGKFDEAVEEFQKAYEIKPTPAYLYNIAQAYRQKGDASKAVFFYKRYLQKAPEASNRATVEKRIAELEELAKKQEESKATPPLSLEGEKTEPTPTAPAGPVVPPGPAEPTDTTTVTTTSRSRSVVRLALEAGPAFVNLGGGPDVPMQVSVRLGGAYTLHAGPVDLDLGAAVTVTPMPFETLDRMDSGTAMLIGLLANVGVRYPVAGKLSLRGELGGGAVAFVGLQTGNPFTQNGKAGGVTMPHFRFAVGADYEIGGGLLATLTPAFSLSLPGGRIDSRIDSITRFDVLLGLAYTL